MELRVAKVDILPTTNLTDLNEDCLIHIFKLINMNDLASIAQVCRKLQASAESWFVYHHNNRLVFAETAKGRAYQHIFFERLVKVFGPKATKIDIRLWGVHSTRFEQPKLMEVLTKYCSSNVESLTLHGVEIDSAYYEQQTITNLRKLLSNTKLRKLSLKNVNMYEYKSFFQYFRKNVESIKLVLVEMDKMTTSGFLRKYPNLRDLSITDVVAEYDEDIEGYPETPKPLKPADFERLLHLNRHIQSISIDKANLTQSMFVAICSLPQLSQLTLFISHESPEFDLTQLIKLKFLKTLKISAYFHTFDVIALELAKSEHLTEMTLLNVRLDDVDFFAKLSQRPGPQNLRLKNVYVLDGSQISIDLRRAEIKNGKYQNFTPC